ncbi:MAG: ribulokinase [Candidatus Sumerlaeia bacterium]|nr:ribulokinase [Candidatus Sumerlaeia bacterium]
MAEKYTIGLDYGSNSVRALIVNVRDGREVASATSVYRHGESGIILDSRNPDLARQHPMDYLSGLEETVLQAVGEAAERESLNPADIVGIGVDTTGSTPLPLDGQGRALVEHADFEEHPSAMAWLWKDHTGHREAAEITALAREHRPEYLERCGGVYSSEWFWSKVLACLRTAPDVFKAADTWVEIADWIPAVLCGTTNPRKLKRGICAAGHKAFFHDSWGGYPDEEFLEKLDPGLVRIRRSLPDRTYSIAESAGKLSDEWADRLGLRAGIPVAVGAFDAHLGAVGSGISEGTLVKIVGTSTCDIMVAPLEKDLPLISGLCGIVPESVLPGFHGLEAGQSAVGDIFNWFVNVVGPNNMGHDDLTVAAEGIRPGESGLLALDWNNGNRTILVDQRLTGLLLGMTLQSTPGELYRALIEATAFGARVIVDRLEEYGVPINRVVTCGGISTKNRLLLQIYADVLNRPIHVSSSSQTCALGAAISGAVVAGVHQDFRSAVHSMTSLKEETFQPDPRASAIYGELFALYRKLHDLFGMEDGTGSPYRVMKELLDLRDRVRKQ